MQMPPLTTGNPAITLSGLVFAHRVLVDNAGPPVAATDRTVATGANVAVGLVTALTSAAAVTRVNYANTGVQVGDVVL
jgi:hypothetical protein